MTEEQMEKAKKLVSENKNEKCINCGTTSGFRVSPFLVYLPSEEKYEGRNLNFPLVVATCPNCHFVYQFSAITGGVVESPKEFDSFK